MGYITTLLDEAVEKKRRNQEALRQRLLEKLFDALDRVSKELVFEDAYAFGSVTKPFRFSEISDIDVGFIGLDDRDFFKMMSYLSAKTGLDVDIVQLEDHRLAEKVKREGIRWKKTD